MKKTHLNNKGFSMIGLVIAIALMLILMAMYLPNVVGNGTATENVTELKTTASTIYNAAQIYLSTQQASGAQPQPNGTIPSSKLTSGLDTSMYKTIEVKLNESGTAVKYVYLETNSGTKCDFPAGSSGKAD